MRERAGVRVHLLPELAQCHRRVAADAEAEDRVVRLVEEGVQPRQSAGLAEARQQVIAVALQRPLAEVGLVPVARQRQAAGLRCAAQPGALDQLVVLDEAQEHAAQQPVHACLRDDLVGPALESLCRAVGVARGLPLGLQAGLQLGYLGDALAQVVFEALEQARQVREQLWGVDH